jgi:hypothetical protein
MSGMVLRHLTFLGPERSAASISFDSGLNVVCGASETGKSFLAESIDFMLGQEDPVRDIPERAGYDRVRLAIESLGWPSLTIDRSVEGGNFRVYEELLSANPPQTEAKTLRWKHSAARQDTLSYALLERTGLRSKLLRRNAGGDTRSLSFRDLARLCVATEDEIQGRGSPFLSGQYVTATGEYAALKLLLTGNDDSALVATKEGVGRKERDSGKIELLDQMIADAQAILDEEGIEEAELSAHLERVEAAIALQSTTLSNVQRAFDSLLKRRGDAAKEIRHRNGRIGEIDELITRFTLLDRHYQTDLERLRAIHESGSLFVHLDQKQCPLCGAMPEAQHLEAECSGNTEAVVKSADAEILKIRQLKQELSATVSTLSAERSQLVESLSQFEASYKDCESELGEIVAPSVSNERNSYDHLVAERTEVKLKLEKIARLNQLVAQRGEFDDELPDTPSVLSTGKTQISKSVLDDFAKLVERLLQEWRFPNANRVFFDEGKRDFQIAGKDRGSTGKGLRAITHAAVKIGLMEFCRERNLPHPGFVVLDSPLLAYWKPEGIDDDLRGSDLKDLFYRYLLGLSKDSQVIIIENEHPPQFVFDEAKVIVFTKNPKQGRYGFFPQP